MKKSTLAFLCVVILALITAFAAVMVLHQDRDVTVTAEVTTGDPAAAAGLTATQMAEYKADKAWTLTIPLDRPQDTTTAHGDVTPDLLRDLTGPLRLAGDLFGNQTQHIFQDGETLRDRADSYPEIAAALPMLEDMMTRAPLGEAYTETFYLADYMDRFPVTVRCWEEAYPGSLDAICNEPEVWAAFADYFQIPLPDGARWTFTVTLDPQGALTEVRLGSNNFGFPDMVSATGAHTVYFALDPGTSPPLSYEKVPGGFGIYAMDFSRETQEGWSRTRVHADTLTTVFPLPEGAAALDMNLSPDGKDLFLVYGLDRDTTLLVLDTATWTVKQSLPVPTDPPSAGDGLYLNRDGTTTKYPTRQWEINGSDQGCTSLVDEDCYALFGHRLYCFTRQAGEYALAFTAEDCDLLRLSALGTNPTARMLWHNGTLALAAPRQSGQTGLTLQLYDHTGALTYAADYTTSLTTGDPNDLADQGVFLTPIQPMPGYELELTWN